MAAIDRLFASVFLSLVLVAVPAAAAQRVVPQSQAQIKLSFAPVVRETAPAVVNIYAQRTVQQPVSPMFDDPFFKRFFGDAFGGGITRERRQQSLGSGVIVDPHGLIVTNRHVINGADAIRVVLGDRRELDAKVMLSDERTDLAVLKVDDGGKPLPYLQTSPSDELQVGDLVLAIGNPFGVGQTVTSGIVSALARTGIGASDYRSFIQTDAAINPGNSGGALVSLDGKLVGINSAIYTKTGGSVGIGFAIPSEMVDTVIQAALHGGQIERPWIGFHSQEVTSELARGFGLDAPRGVLVTDVYPGSPPANAGLKRGDVIEAMDGREVDDPEALAFRVATRPIGSRAEFEILRDGHQLTLRWPMEKAPENPPRHETVLSGRHPLAGTKVVNLSPAVAEELGIRKWHGVALIAIARNSPARRYGFEPGDVLISVNGQRIESVDGLDRLLSNQDRWSLVISRNGEQRRLEIVG
ncbi:serine protease Do [Tistlia consotensis]|uniref:Serine protease Do n=1 Tax=Tistlia consotensis USBA 355 TaxID=560819 RepID=A0A1Y6C8Q9_9PROT|nr:DegQ family serine endoprotease [Tistlia consotensis]SMF43116.1 serine protease Do [Tistlia consotensis USBA 355]SNR42242.1 serine protease Do [Tistlia consotensis]